MHLTFLGTGTSMGVPIIGCRCAVCTSPDPRDKRLRTSALLAQGAARLLIDTGPDFRAQALAAQMTRLDAVLLTHSHYDHVAGIDDLRPLIPRGHALPLHGSPRTLEQVRERFSYAFAAVDDGSTRPTLTLKPFTTGEPFEAAGIEVLPFAVQHGTWSINGFRVGRLGYITDASALPAESRAVLRGLDVLVLNALRFITHPTHFTLDEALGVVEDLQPRRTFLVHLTHAFAHASQRTYLPPGVHLAYDGLTLEIAN